MQLRRLSSTEPDFSGQLTALCIDTAEPDAEISGVVASILSDVRRRGDEALLEYTNRFDERDSVIEDIEISATEIEAALNAIPDELRTALEYAADRVRKYHAKQLLKSWQYQDEQGNTLGQKITALDSVGIYVPGGKASYPSSVLMNAIPASVAGVADIIMVVPTPKNQKNQAVLAAAAIAGVKRVFSVGGAQAVAALAYGTESIPKVDKIVGPGNAYVATAKRQVFGTVGIDIIAGPSEVLIVSDGDGDPDWVAMDLFAQAEHAEDSRSILICTSADFLDAVEESMSRLLPQMERHEIIKSALDQYGMAILVEDLQQAVECVNKIAAEHLQLCVRDPDALLPAIRHAGAIFVGHYAAEVLGDYCAGPNHVLPTATTARFSSPLGVYDFQKRSSLIICNEDSVSSLARTAKVLAEEEGLTAHARSAEYRIKS